MTAHRANAATICDSSAALAARPNDLPAFSRPDGLSAVKSGPALPVSTDPWCHSWRNIRPSAACTASTQARQASLVRASSRANIGLEAALGWSTAQASQTTSAVPPSARRR